ncbi:VOC family protein [Microbacterium wangruii]|uniref:VOC family protein n=1 Tax=Microbacterium wangruii TaxID=3049073 RepID=UPI00254DFBFD|nr:MULTISPECIES: VOC family protein [unclassified Microbacterium]WIM29436.1 VOC family protein [Microbacterium sp. zg-Y1090]
MIRITTTSVYVDEQSKALDFYTEKLGFMKQVDVPTGEYRWLTVSSPADPNGVQVLLEPDQHPAAKAFKAALVEDGIPFTQFAVDDIDREVARMKELGVRFTQDVTDYGNVAVAVFDDTCGNLIQLAMMKGSAA